MILQEKNESMQHGVNDEVRVLKECVKKLEGDVRPPRQRGERECWASVQYSRRECVGVT